jgi:nucleotide-binding universal stress UspA family protein
MRTILVPLDGSMLAESALPMAAAIAARWGARVVLAGVHEPGLPVHGGRGTAAYDQRRSAELRAALESSLEAAAQRISTTAPGAAVDIALLDGDVASALASHASDVGADLVVLSSHGRGGASRRWLGSVTDELMRRVAIPLLVLRAGETDASRRHSAGEFHHVLVPLDGTAAGEKAIDMAQLVAGTKGVHYTLLRVASPLHPLLQAVPVEPAVERDAVEQRQQAEREVADTASRFRARGFDVSTIVRMELQPARAILAVAEEIGADLIAMATHGRGPLRRFLLGSTAPKVLLGAPVPVLVHRLAEESATAAEPPTLASSAAATTPSPLHTKAAAAPAPRLQCVVVGLDFAEPSRHAAEWTARHLASGAQLVLVHAASVPEPPAFLGRSSSAREQVMESVHRGAEIRMRELVPTLGAPRVFPEIRDGAPHSEIAAAAAAYQADLIVVGAHGEHTGLSSLLGTTAQRVVRTSPAPVLLARELPNGPPRRLLAAINDSTDTDLVLAWTGFLSARFGAPVVLLHAVSPMMSVAVAVGASASERERAVDQVHEEASRWLDAKARLCGDAVTAITTSVAFGDPATAIADTAQRVGADLIIMGRGGTGSTARMFLGSTTERILRHGDLPVLVAISAGGATRGDAERQG